VVDCAREQGPKARPGPAQADPRPRGARKEERVFCAYGPHCPRKLGPRRRRLCRVLRDSVGAGARQGRAPGMRSMEYAATADSGAPGQRVLEH